MRQRVGYLTSILLHVVCFWSLTAAQRWIPVRVAVRAGDAAPASSQAARAIDARMTPPTEPPPVEPIVIEVPTEPGPPIETSPPTVADRDAQPVVPPPVTETQRQRSERRVNVVELAMAPRLAERNDPTSIESDGRRTPLDWPTIPEAAAPDPERLPVEKPQPPRRMPTAPPVPIIEPGDAAASTLAANAPQGAQVDQLPRQLPTNREPEYPEDLRRRQIGGLVLLKVTIGPDGSVEAVEVDRSSGEPALDRSAQTAVAQWRFEPARRGQTAVRFSVRLPVRFSIRTGS